MVIFAVRVLLEGRDFLFEFLQQDKNVRVTSGVFSFGPVNSYTDFGFEFLVGK